MFVAAFAIVGPWLKIQMNSVHTVRSQIYRVSIKSFSDYKHLLQENYVEYKHIFFHPYLSQFLKFYVMCLLLCQSCITCQCQNGVIISVCNQGKTLCSPCISILCTHIRLGLSCCVLPANHLNVICSALVAFLMLALGLEIQQSLLSYR